MFNLIPNLKFKLYITSSEIFKNTKDRYAISTGKLFVPTSYLKKEYFTISKLKYFKMIRQYGVFDLVQILAKINFFSNLDFKVKGFSEQRIVNDLIYDVFLKKRIVQNLKDKTFFIRPQLLSLMKFSILLSNNKNPLGVFDNIKDFTYILIKTNDLLEQDIADDIKKYKNKITNKIKAGFIRGYEFNYTQQLRYLITRYRLLFYHYSKKVRNPRFPIVREFQNITGINIKLFMALIMGIISFYDKHNIKTILDDPNSFFMGKKFFKRIKSNKRSSIKQLFNLISNTPEEFKREIKKEKFDKENKFFGFLCFRKKPVIKVNENLYIPLDIEFIKNKMTTEVYWEIFFNTNKDRNILSTFWGKTFEYYVKSILKRCFNDGESIFFEDKRRGQNIDAIIYQKQSLIFLEFLTTKIPYKTLLSFDYNAIMQRVETIFFGKDKIKRKGKIIQINSEISRFKNKSLRIKKLNPEEIKNYYPVILFEKAPPQVPGLWKEYRSLIKKFSNADSLRNKSHSLNDCFDELQFLEIEELEMLEPLLNIGLDFIDLLEEKINSEFHDLPFRSFFHAKIYPDKFGNKEPPNKYLEKEFKNFAVETSNILFKHK